MRLAPRVVSDRARGSGGGLVTVTSTIIGPSTRKVKDTTGVQCQHVTRVVVACAAYQRVHGSHAGEDEIASLLEREHAQHPVTTRNALVAARSRGLLRGTRVTLDGESWLAGPGGEVWRQSGRRAG